MQQGARLTRIRATRETCSDWPEVPMVGQLGSRDPVLSGGQASGTWDRIRRA
jgi:hypothetical protein